MKKIAFCFLFVLSIFFPCFAQEVENVVVFTSSDYKRIGKNVADQIIQSGVLENVSEKKYSMMFGRIINESFYNFDIDDLIKNIRSAIKSRINVVRTNKKDLDFVLAGRLTERTATLLSKKTRKEYYLELKLTDLQTNTELKVIKIPFVHKD